MVSRALVLGGGGLTGLAWKLGILAGLAAAGCDLRDADLIVGTSSGAALAAQIGSGVNLDGLFQRQLAQSDGEIPAKIGIGMRIRYGWAALGSREPQRHRARIGAMARAAHTIPPADRLAVIASRLGSDDWPDRRMILIAVNAETGEFQTFDRDSGVSLIDAVAASCAVPGIWPPARVDGRLWVDGAVRSPTNADLAVGYDRVVVLAPWTAGFGPVPSLASQVAVLARSIVVSPDRPARRAMGRNILDPARRAASARAGLAQAPLVAAGVTEVWSD